MIFTRTLLAAALTVSAVSAQSISEPPDFSNSFPGTGPTISGQNCVLVAAGTIEPGDVDWIRITLPVAMGQTVVDLDFPEGAGASALFVQVEGGSSGFNTGDSNNPLDNRCGLGSDTNPVGSTTDAIVSVGATPAGAILDIGVTGGADGGFTGAHSENFAYQVWAHLTPVPCTSDDDCGDPHDCTVDTCNTDTGECTNVPNDSFCDDGTFCNGQESCDADAGCQIGVSPACDDGVECTDDACDLLTDGCANTPNNTSCDNGVFCDGSETCDALTGCVDGPPPTCNDEIECTDDACDEATDSCANTANDSACTDGLICNGHESCDESQGCVPGTPPCGDGLCRESDGGCVDCLKDADCDDGDLCSTPQTCDTNGTCQLGTPLCDKGQTCDPNTGECLQPGDPALSLDIKPGACPNKIPRNSRGFIAAALVSISGFDVRAVDTDSIAIRRADGEGSSVSANTSPPGPPTTLEDVATPAQGDPCDCHSLQGDGDTDLVIRFSVEQLIEALQLTDLPSRESIELLVSGTLIDGSPFELTDCVELSGNSRQSRGVNTKTNTQLQDVPYAPCGAAGAIALILTFAGLLSMRLQSRRNR